MPARVTILAQFGRQCQHEQHQLPHTINDVCERASSVAESGPTSALSPFVLRWCEFEALVRSEAEIVMKCAVTGAAGFIGSHLCEELLRNGHEVVGIDAFIPYYDPAVKRRNLTALEGQPRFHF